jgi:RNA polymerase sigma factor (sigma-70 family)
MPPERDLQRLLDEEPFVRDLARQLVAGEADEVVQRTWLHAAQQGGAGVEKPRHWLARILRNVVANLRRDHRRRTARERAAALPDLVPSSQELAQREESRRALVAAVDALPTTLRTVVLLRWFDGKAPREIAEALGVPAATVSTQLQRALVLLRQRLDADHGGDRRAWMVPLVPFALRPELPPAVPAVPVVGASAAPPLLLGAIAMTSKTKLAAAAALALAAAAWFVFHDPMPPVPNPPVSKTTPAAVPQQGSLGIAADAGVPATALEREVVQVPSAAASAESGTVIVRLVHHDRTPAAGAMLTLRERSEDVLFGGLRQRTDAFGIARFEAVAPGRLVAAFELSWETRKNIDLAAGRTVEVELALEGGLDVRGLVVDANKNPVAGALVELAMMARGDAFPEVVAVTGADGRFVARGCPELCLLGARAEGHRASNLRFLHGKAGNHAEVELVLGGEGGTVRGAVVDPTGKPVPGAVVIVGAGEVAGIGGRDNLPPFGGLTRTDERGEFSVVGLAVGKQPIRVRGGHLAPWRGEVEVQAGLTVTQRIELGPGAVLRGHVVEGTGKPVARAEIEVGDWGDIDHFHGVSDAEGAFELRGLPVGEVVVRAEHEDHGKARVTVSTIGTEAATCTLTLSRGLELQGRIVDQDGQPISAATIECMAEDPQDNWVVIAHSDAQGRFVAANRPEKGKVALTAHASGYQERMVRGLDPSQAAELRLQRMQPATVHITGRIVDPDGRPVANAGAYAFSQSVRSGPSHAFTDDDGRFELGPLAPGDWALHVRAKGHPEFRSDTRALAANFAWDLGTITMQRGGTARVRLVGEPIDDARFFVVDAARTQTFGFVTTADGKHTEQLAAGDYFLMVQGPTIAATATPFTIRVGEAVVVDAPIERANPQAFRCEVPPGAAVDSVAVLLFRGDTFVGRSWVDGTSSGPSGSIGLAPGAYRAVVEAGALRGSATFVVGAASGPPVTIVLR